MNPGIDLVHSINIPLFIVGSLGLANHPGRAMALETRPGRGEGVMMIMIRAPARKLTTERASPWLPDAIYHTPPSLTGLNPNQGNDLSGAQVSSIGRLVPHQHVFPTMMGASRRQRLALER